MELRLSEHGVTFATRERAAAIVESLAPTTELEVNFDGVKAASPSFLDSLFGSLSEKAERVRIASVAPELAALVERVIERRKLKSRFRLLATAQ
jgi:hypothetical protein